MKVAQIKQKLRLFNTGCLRHRVNTGITYLKVVKTVAVILMVSVSQITANALNAFAQEITLKTKNQSLEHVLNEIRKQSGYKLLYNSNLLKNAKGVTVNLRKSSVREALDAVMRDQPFTYNINDASIILMDKKGRAAANVINSDTQQRIVRGTVKDISGKPLSGVTVLEKQSQKATTTNDQGVFELSVNNNASVLQIKSLGYEDQEVSITNNMLIVLKANVESLDEVVVVGFGTQKKVNLTGAITSVSTEDLKSRPVANVTQALQGLVPGMNFSYGGNGGKVGSAMNINIRGAGTLDPKISNASPLVLIDGMEGNINNINPEDIENISVLKDAAASSIYGSRAPFGVILITTKRGKAGRLNVNYRNNFNWSSAINMPKTADSYSYANYLNQILFNDGQSGWFSNEDLQRIKDYQEGRITTTTIPDKNTPTIWWWAGNDNVDWLETLFGGTSFSQEHSLSLNGGGEKTQMYLSANYLNQNGIVRYGGENMGRININGNINTQVTPWLKANYGTKWTRRDLDQPGVLGDHLFYYNTMRRWPTQPIYDPNGNLLTELTKQLQTSGNNITQTDWLIQQLQLEFEPVKNWKTFVEVNYKTINIGYDEIRKKLPKYNVEGSLYYDAGERSSIYSNSERTNFFNTNIYSEYSHSG